MKYDWREAGEEWSQPWDKLSGQSKNTADKVSAFGGTQFGPDNLRIGALALGLTDYNPAPLGNYVTDCMKAVRNTYEAELKSLKLI